MVARRVRRDSREPRFRRWAGDSGRMRTRPAWQRRRGRFCPEAAATSRRPLTPRTRPAAYARSAVADRAVVLSPLSSGIVALGAAFSPKRKRAERAVAARDTDVVDDRSAFDVLTPVADPGVGSWAVAAAGKWGTVACVVPAAFADYARLFHPAWRTPQSLRTVRLADGSNLDLRIESADSEVRWSEVAAANGKVAHPAMEWASITGHWRYHWGNGTQPGLWDYQPEEGSMSECQVVELAVVLADHTQTPDDCLFAIWEGFGDLPEQLESMPKLQMPQRKMVLFRGPLSAAGLSFGEIRWGSRSPSLWWPADRAWCVGTDVDLRSSYVGGSVACIDAIVNHPELEAMRVTAEQWLTADADQINPEPVGEYPYG
jgi:hypothetical protein